LNNFLKSIGAYNTVLTLYNKKPKENLVLKMAVATGGASQRQTWALAPTLLACFTTAYSAILIILLCEKLLCKAMKHIKNGKPRLQPGENKQKMIEEASSTPSYCC